MNPAIGATHDPALRSWVETANDAAGDFPIQNLPFGIFRRARRSEPFRAGVAIGDRILDLQALHGRRIVRGPAAAAIEACTDSSLNRFMSMGPSAASNLRAALSQILRDGPLGNPELAADLVKQSEAEYKLPAVIGDYTDFYASIHHAQAVGRLFRPDNPLTQNYRWMPIAYHGRTSSIGVSGQDFHRPLGQSLPAGATSPVFGPSRRLDFELEVGIFIGAGNRQGTPIPVQQAEEHVFGLCLLNDWSARDIQAWEYQPLGPFLGKNFATTISPWIVTLEALAPFRGPSVRPASDPQLLPYLDHEESRTTGAFDLTLEVFLQTAGMRAAGMAPARLLGSNFKHSYWTVAQMLAHHTVGGCNLQPGDLLGSGTQSGPTPPEAGSLLELTAGGSRPMLLPNGESRLFLQDGDLITLTGCCERAGFARIGFGAAAAQVLPAHAGT
jgi:fumarylacetoacetase